MIPKSSSLWFINWPLALIGITFAWLLILLANHTLVLPHSGTQLTLDAIPVVAWLGMTLLINRPNLGAVSFWLGAGFSMLYLGALIQLSGHLTQAITSDWLEQVPDALGSLFLTVGLIRCIHQLNDQNQLMSHLATGTPLASLANSRNFYQHTPNVTRERRAALLMISVDNFQQLCQQQGQACCDYQLVKLAELIGGSIRKHDRVVRWGGEEFVLELGGADMNTARVKAEHLRMMIAEHAFGFAGLSLRLTVSIGIAEYDGLLANRKLAILSAKDVMQQCAALGGNKVMVFEPEPRMQDTEQTELPDAANDPESRSSGKPH